MMITKHDGQNHLYEFGVSSLLVLGFQNGKGVAVRTSVSCWTGRLEIQKILTTGAENLYCGVM